MNALSLKWDPGNASEAVSNYALRLTVCESYARTRNRPAAVLHAATAITFIRHDKMNRDCFMCPPSVRQQETALIVRYLPLLFLKDRIRISLELNQSSWQGTRSCSWTQRCRDLRRRALVLACPCSPYSGLRSGIRKCPQCEFRNQAPLNPHPISSGSYL